MKTNTYKHSDEIKKIISSKMKGNTNWKNSIDKSGRGKKGYYKSYYFMSTWELAFIVYCLDHNIQFYRNWEKFNYVDENGEIRIYIPDFYLIEEEKFVEVKGYNNLRFQCKLKHFPHSIKVLYKDEMKNIIDYVSKKYGDNFYDSLIEHKEKKYKITRDEWINQIKKENNLKHKENIIKIETSNIDFSKYGWSNKVSIILNISPQHVNKWMKRFMPDFYATKCFKRAPSQSRTDE